MSDLTQAAQAAERDAFVAYVGKRWGLSTFDDCRRVENWDLWLSAWDAALAAAAPADQAAYVPMTPEEISETVLAAKVLCVHPDASTTIDIARAVEAEVLRRINAKVTG